MLNNEVFIHKMNAQINITTESSDTSNISNGNNSSQSNASNSNNNNIIDITDVSMPSIDVHSNHINETYSSFKAHFLLHQERNLAAEQTGSTKQFLKKLMSTFGINMCPPQPINLDGPIAIDTDFEELSSVEQRLGGQLLMGGWYKPKECNAKDRVAIVIPYRDRATHLPIFLKNVHPFLMKQQIEYGIFIIEQISDGLFNRAALMNVGFVEALKLNEWDCFIFHDIDLIPMDGRNLYTCPDQPRHMSVAVDTMGFKYVTTMMKMIENRIRNGSLINLLNFRLPYSSIFGGVSAMTVKQFRTVNGFSNAFWGWGGEDDDMSNRFGTNYNLILFK